MNKINIWNVKHPYKNEMLDIIDKNVNHSTRLLDLSKEKYSLLEKIVYDTALFHFTRLNIDITNNHYVEFWCKNKFDTNVLHVDCDEYEKKTSLNYIYPLLSCVTYFNENPCPTIITNIDLDDYKYKEFEKQTDLFLSMPKTNKQITFDGHYFHGSTLFTKDDAHKSRYIIAINLWDKKPINVDYYSAEETNFDNFGKSEAQFTLELQENNTSVINVSKNILNYNFYEDILYNKNELACSMFHKLISEISLEQNSSSYRFILDNTLEKKELELKLKNAYGDIINDINQIMNETIQLKYNRFLQRFQYTQVYTPDICRFIINECEKYAQNNGGWTTKRHHNYPTTDLPVEKIVTIFGIILETMKTIVAKIKKSYCLDDKIIVNFRDLFVVKYTDNAQNHLDMHHDGSFLSFNILLSDQNDFEGGGTYFDDGLISYLEQGDVLIHSSRIKHAGLPITKGTRYLLVGFLNIDLPISE